MELAGELLSLVVSLSQQIGIVVGVGALTVTLVGHLLSLHAHKNETVFAYVRAARSIRAMALMLIIVSGGAAILIHFQTQTLSVLAAPAFLFKWLLIILLTAFYFIELKVEGVKRDAVEGFEGANWYALLIVHTMAPVAGWLLMLYIYLGWLAAFAVIWAGFVWVMRRYSTLDSGAAPKSGRGPNPFAPPAKAPVASKPTPTPAAPVAQKPIEAPKPKAPVPVSKVEVHPNHTLLPMIAELDLPAPHKAPVPQAAPLPPAPAPIPLVPKPAAPVTIVPESSKPAVQMPNLEESGLAALHVMPKRPEDIAHSRRGPVVKMSEE